MANQEKPKDEKRGLLSEAGKGKTNTEPIGEIFKSMNDFFHQKPVKGFLQSIDEFFQRPFPVSPFKIEVEETNNEFILTAELPGVKREQLKVDLYRTQAIISIESNEKLIEENEAAKAFQIKQSSNRTSKSVSFPSPISEKKARASYRDGLLVLHLPKDKGKTLKIE